MFPLSPPPAVSTSQTELTGTTAGIIAVAVVAIVALGMLLIPVFWASRESGKSVRMSGGASRDAGDRPPGQGHWPSERREDRHIRGRGSSHGRPASWVLVAVMLAAFLAGGLAIITHAWWLMWTCAGVILAAVPAGKAIGIMDDTVIWGSNPAALPDQPSESGPGSLTGPPSRPAPW